MARAGTFDEKAGVAPHYARVGGVIVDYASRKLRLKLLHENRATDGLLSVHLRAALCAVVRVQLRSTAPTRAPVATYSSWPRLHG
jgi:hypothetical protein